MKKEIFSSTLLENLKQLLEKCVSNQESMNVFRFWGKEIRLGDGVPVPGVESGYRKASQGLFLAPLSGKGAKGAKPLLNYFPPLL